MKTCPKCQTEYDDTKKFCRHDGSPLVEKKTEERPAKASVPSCPQCGNSLEAGKKFCRHCGAKLETGFQSLSEETEETVILAPPIEQRNLDPQIAKIARLERQVQEEPGRLSEIVELAECYLEAKRAQQAVNLLKPSVAYAPEDIRLYLLLGKAQETIGDLPSAFASYLAALERDAWNPEVEAALFREDFLLSTYPRSVDELAETAAQRGSVQMWQLLARVSEAKGDSDKAIAFLTEAIQLTPDDVTVLASLARISEKRQEREEAKQWHQRILEVSPNSQFSNLFFAQEHYTRGEYHEAVAYFERLLAQEQNNRVYQLYWLLANVKGSDLHGYERSIADASQWQNLSSDEKSLARELFVLAGRENLENDNLASAEQFLLRAQHISPSQDAAKMLAAVEEKKGDEAHVGGDFNQAVASYQRAVAHDPSNHTSTQKLAQLVSLRTQERRQKRQEVRSKIAQGTGLALIAVVLIGLGFFSYHKAREWWQRPVPQHEGVAVANDSSSLPKKELTPSPPAETENRPQRAEEYGTKSDSPSFVAEPAKEQSPGLEEGQPQPPVAEPQQVAKATEPLKGELQRGSVVTAKELEIRVTGKGANDLHRSPEAIQQEIESHFFELQEAYEAERGSDPSLMGSLVLDLSIAPDGHTSRVRFRSAKIPSKTLQDMILGLAHEWRFSPASAAVQVFYPLLFLPPGMDAATITAWEKRTAALEVTQRRPQEEQTPPVQAEPVRERQYAAKQVPEQRRETVRERLYEVITPTLLRSEPRADASVVARLQPGIKVRIVGRVGDFLQVRSRKGNTPGYVSREDVVRGE